MASARLLLICSGFPAAASFQFTPHRSFHRGSHRNLEHKTTCIRPTNAQQQSFLPPLFQSSYDDDEDDEIDIGSLGDWRQFRMNLINSASTMSSSEVVSSLDGIDLTEESASVTTTKVRPTSVSRRNEELLMAQSEMLGEEYIRGVWAHESAVVSIYFVDCAS
jgi:hypothetical protein